MHKHRQQPARQQADQHSSAVAALPRERRSITQHVCQACTLKALACTAGPQALCC